MRTEEEARPNAGKINPSRTRAPRVTRASALRVAVLDAFFLGRDAKTIYARGGIRKFKVIAVDRGFRTAVEVILIFPDFLAREIF